MGYLNKPHFLYFALIRGKGEGLLAWEAAGGNVASLSSCFKGGFRQALEPRPPTGNGLSYYRAPPAWGRRPLASLGYIYIFHNFYPLVSYSIPSTSPTQLHPSPLSLLPFHRPPTQLHPSPLPNFPFPTKLSPSTPLLVTYPSIPSHPLPF